MGLVPMAMAASKAAAPPVATDDDITTDRDTPGFVNVLENDFDDDGDELTVTTLAPTAANGDVSCDEFGDCTYTPDPDFVGTDSFTYSISDGNGGTDTGMVNVIVQEACNPAARTLTNGNPDTTDGALSVNVDGLGEIDDDAPFNPPGALERAGTIFSSNLYIDQVDQMLDDDCGHGQATVLSESPTSLETQLDINSLRLHVTQSLGAITAGSSVLTQTYEITNLSGSSVPLALVRHVDGDLAFDGSISDGGAATADGSTLYEFDASDDPSNPSTFVGISGALGSQNAPDAWTMQSYDYRPAILDANGIPPTDAGQIFNDTDGDRIVDTPYDVTLSQQWNANVGAGGSITFTTVTRFGRQPPNLAPNAVDDEASTSADTPVTIDVLANDSDADGDAITVTTPAPTAAHGTVTCGGGGSCTYTPDPGFTGTDSFTYEIADGRGGTDSATVTVEVASINTPPDAVGDEVTTAQDTPVSFNVLNNDSDADGDALTVTTLSPTAEHGDVTCDEFGDCTYTPDPGFVGTDTFDYSVSDGNGGTDTATVTVTVEEVLPNNQPVAVDDAADAITATPKRIEVLANDSDPDGDFLEVASVTDPANGTASTDGSEVTYTSDAGFEGTDTFDYTVSDGSGGTDTATVTVNVQSCPELGPAIDDDGIVTGERWVVCSSLAANAQVTQMTPLLPPSGTHEALMTSGDVANAPGPNDETGAGTDNETSLRGANDPSILQLDINVPEGDNCLSFDLVFGSEEYPEFVNQGFNDGFLAELDVSDWSVDESTSTITAPNNFAFDGSGNIVSVNSAFFDPGRVVEDTGTQYDGSTPLLKVQTPITSGAHSLYLSIFDAGDGVLDSGAFFDRLKTAQVAEGGCEEGANQAPTAADDSLTTDEDTAKAIDVLTNDVDPDGDTLTVTGSTNGAHGTVNCTPAGTCTYTPDANFHGTDSFTYTISDGRGGSDTATVNVTVNSINDAPNAVGDSLTTDEDVPKAVDVLANDSDVDGDTLTVTGSTNGAHGTVICTTAGSCTYTPDEGFAGTDSFTYTISDGHGGTDTATVNVTVNAGSNTAPTAEDDSLTTDEDTAESINVLTNDSDIDGDTLEVTGSTNGAHGTVTCTPAGSCTYTPDANYNGPDSFTYTISDGNGGTDTATVAVTVTPVNDAPVADDESLTTHEDNPGTIAVLPGDTDVDGDTLTVTGSTNGAHGTVVCSSAGLCTYTPDANFHGSDSFTYSVSDGHGGTDTGTVNVTVLPVNDAPDAVDDSLTTDKDVPKAVNVLTNDTDIDGNALTVTDATDGAHGTVECTLEGSCTYTPDANFHGTDTFTYTISDGNGGSDTATVNVTVNEVTNAGPIADAGLDQAADEGATVHLDGAGSSDPDGDPLTYEWTVDDGRTFSGAQADIPFGDDGQFVVTLEVCDDGAPALCNTDTVVVTVANKKPVVNVTEKPKVIRINTNQANDTAHAVFDATATDVPADVLIYEWDFGDGNGSGPQSAAAAEHDYSELGKHRVVLTVTDGDGGVSTKRFNVFVMAEGSCGNLKEAHWDGPGQRVGVRARTRLYKLIGQGLERTNQAMKARDVARLGARNSDPDKLQTLCHRGDRYMEIRLDGRSYFIRERVLVKL